MISKEQAEKISRFSVNQDVYTLDDVYNVPHNYLTIQIYDNKCRILQSEILPDGRMEQRQYSMGKLLQSVLQRHQVPNVLFSWCTHDRTNMPHGKIFTHARLPGSNNVIAPDHTFFGYPNTNPDIINTYVGSHKSLGNTNIEWSKKRDECVFIGNLSNPTNYRRQNSSMNLKNEITLRIIDQNSGDSSFISRESLAESKYLLHLNGHRGAYTSRIKFLLGAGSAVLYNINSGPEQNFWQEWWMDESIFQNGYHYLKLQNAKETEDVINHFHDKQEEIAQIAANGKSFFCNTLNPESVYLVWSEILKEYSRKCNFNVTEPQGFEFTRNDYAEAE